MHHQFFVKNKCMNTIQHIIVTKSLHTKLYKSSEPMFHDFYLLSLLLDNYEINHSNFVNFYKSSSISCWATDQLFMHKHGKNIELFSVHDLASNDDLHLPKTLKFTLSKTNFAQCIMQIKKLQDEQAAKIYIAIDELGAVYFTHNLASIKKYNFLSSLYSSIKFLFIRK